NFSGTGSINKIGTNTLFVSGNNTFSGTTTISSGTLKVLSALALQHSTLAVGTGTAVTFSGATTLGGLAGAGNLDTSVALTIGGNGANTTYSGALSGSVSVTKS